MSIGIPCPPSRRREPGPAGLPKARGVVPERDQKKKKKKKQKVQSFLYGVDTNYTKVHNIYKIKKVKEVDDMKND